MQRALQKKKWFLKGWFKSWSGIKRKMRNWSWWSQHLHCCSPPARRQAQSSLTSLFFQNKGGKKSKVVLVAHEQWSTEPLGEVSQGRSSLTPGTGPSRATRLPQELAQAAPGTGNLPSPAGWQLWAASAPVSQQEMLHVPPPHILDNSN